MCVNGGDMQHAGTRSRLRRGDVLLGAVIAHPFGCKLCTP